MKPDPVHRYSPSTNKKRVSPLPKYLISFSLMMIFTMAAFWIVADRQYSREATIWIISGLAILQVFLQLFTFMHLDQKGYGTVIVMMAFAIVIALVSAVGLVIVDIPK
jgi:cytochrome c oxidase subunit IV